MQCNEIVLTRMGNTYGDIDFDLSHHENLICLMDFFVNFYSFSQGIPDKSCSQEWDRCRYRRTVQTTAFFAAI